MAFNIGITVNAKNNSGRALGQVNKDLDKTGRKAQQTTKALKGLRLALGLIAVGVLVNFGKQLVQTTGKLQLMLIRLANVEGGAKQARTTFDKLFKTFGSSPFTIDAVTDSFVRLRAAGIESKLAFEAVEAGADAIAAFGGTSEELKRFSIGLQQVAGKGVLSMEELRQQIGEALPVAMQVFAAESGRSISEVITDVEAGRISANEFITLLTKGLQARFGGFAAKLGDTVLGSIQGAKSKISKAIADVFLGNTDVAVRITAIIQQVGEVIEDFIRTITQSDVDEFFKGFATGATFALALATAVIAVAKSVLMFSNFVTGLIGEHASLIGGLGLIGLVLFGPAGAIVGIVVGINALLDRLGGLKGVLESITGITVGNSLVEDFGRASGAVKGAHGAVNDFFDGLDKQVEKASKKKSIFEVFTAQEDRIKKITANNAAAANPNKNFKLAAEGLGKTAAAAFAQLEKLSERTSAALAGAVTFPFVKTAETSLNRLKGYIKDFEGPRKQLEKLAANASRTDMEQAQFEALNRELKKTDGLIVKVKEDVEAIKAEKFAQALAKANDATGKVLADFDKLTVGISEGDRKLNSIKESFRDIEARLKEQLKVQLALSDLDATKITLLEGTRSRLARNAAEREKALNLARSQIVIDEKILAIQTRMAELKVKSQIDQLKRDTRSGLETILSTDSGDEASQRRSDLKQSILATKERLLDIETQINDPKISDAKLLALGAELEMTQRLEKEQIKALHNTTAAGIAANQMWMTVRDTMVNVAEDGIKGLITGTKSFKDVQLDAMNAITEAAIKFLVKLIRIKIEKMLIASIDASGGGGFGSILGSFASSLFAKGGAFSGQVKPFAKGDVIRGPTMFGIAGEAGDEAIMPLTRVGGKLGVDTTGSGGDNFAITIQAIDTQTGADFLRKNSDQIINQLRGSNNLNRGVGRIR